MDYMDPPWLIAQGPAQGASWNACSLSGKEAYLLTLKVTAWETGLQFNIHLGANCTTLPDCKGEQAPSSYLPSASTNVSDISQKGALCITLVLWFLLLFSTGTPFKFRAYFHRSLWTITEKVFKTWCSTQAADRSLVFQGHLFAYLNSCGLKVQLSISLHLGTEILLFGTLTGLSIPSATGSHKNKESYLEIHKDVRTKS